MIVQKDQLHCHSAAVSLQTTGGFRLKRAFVAVETLDADMARRRLPLTLPEPQQTLGAEHWLKRV